MSSIQIIDRQSGGVIEAELVCDLRPEDLLRAEEQYRDLRDRRTAEAAAEGDTPPQHSDWDWNLKASNYDRGTCRCFGIRHEGMMQGLMMLSVEPQQSLRPDCEDQQILYVEFIETAPWNQGVYARTSPRYGGIGTQLLRTAIQSSLEAGCEGRIGLHSLPQSEGFYSPNFKDLGVDPAEDLRYFEMSEEPGHESSARTIPMNVPKLSRVQLLRLAKQENNATVTAGDPHAFTRKSVPSSDRLREAGISKKAFASASAK